VTNFRNFDLNLLLVLDGVLREGTFSNAAKALNVSQPTISSSLATFRRKIPGDFALTAPLCRPGSCRGVQNQLRHERIDKA
jgi:hypothetical protein